MNDDDKNQIIGKLLDEIKYIEGKQSAEKRGSVYWNICQGTINGIVQSMAIVHYHYVNKV